MRRSGGAKRRRGRYDGSLLLLLVMLGSACLSGTGAALAQSGDEAALTAAEHDICPRQVAMLGESATHGDGHTETFKVALVERLVTDCGFDSVFFEASHYEFLAIARGLRLRQGVSAEQIGTAVGGLWKFDQQFQPLLTFLAVRAQAGQVSLGGIDDQLGQLGQDFANLRLVTDLTQHLPQPQQARCGSALHQRIYSDYTEADPYTPAARSRISDCLIAIDRAVALSTALSTADRDDEQEMIAAFERWLARDFLTPAEQFAARDRSMYESFAWLRREHPARHKVIVWAATVHIAKVGDPEPARQGDANFGSYVHAAYGNAAFALGFSARTGTYRQGRKDVHAMPAAPQESLEASALRGSHAESAYLGPAALGALGDVPGEVFRHTYQTMRWADALDGVVVFLEERPPQSVTAAGSSGSR